MTDDPFAIFQELAIGEGGHRDCPSCGQGVINQSFHGDIMALNASIYELTQRVNEMAKFLDEIKGPIREAISMYNNHPMVKIRNALGKR